MLTSVKNEGNQLKSFGYDAVGRLSRASDRDGQETTLSYDQADRLVGLQEGGNSTTRSYDSRGNLASQSDPRGSVNYHYDALSRLTSLEDPGDQTISFDYDDEGQLTGQTLPNAVIQSLTYDSEGRTTKSEAKKDNKVLDSFGYSYDKAGNLTGKIDNRGRRQIAYRYDALNRLTRERDDDTQTTFSYDKAGNRTKAGATSYSYNSLNQLARASDGTSYIYDLGGHLTKKQKGALSTSYSWDPLDQLSEVKLPTGHSHSFDYDAFDRLKQTSTPAGTETIHYGDLSDSAAFERDGAGEMVQSYLSGPYGLIESSDSASTSYPLSDAHGDITAVTDQAGSVTSRQSYDAWGVQTAGDPQIYGYLGAFQRRSDPDTGLTQMGARRYAPDLGRFTSEDPVLGYQQMPQTINRYAYAINNPLRYYDLDGRSIFGDMLGEAGDFYSDAFREIGNSDFYRYGVVPAANTVGSVTNWDQFKQDWRAGLDELPRSLVKADKLLAGIGFGAVESCLNRKVLECGSWFIPVGAMVKVGKAGATVVKDGKALKTGGSGRAMRYKVKLPSRKGAKEAASLDRNSRGKPIHHANPKSGRPHYHPGDERGRKIPGGTHYEY